MKLTRINKAGLVVLLMLCAMLLASCVESVRQQEQKAVASQQQQYLIGQPIPQLDWSLERQLVIQLYLIRNSQVATHAVWRSDYGVVEGDCPSMGYGMPYDTSLTNPLQTARYSTGSSSTAVVEQAEPNGVFASKNTSATWVMCLGDAGSIEPVYVESKVTVYPGPVEVDYVKNLVTRSGAATVRISESALQK